MFRVKKDAKICLIVTIFIIGAIFISTLVFHVDISSYLLTIGFFFVVLLPVYILHRIRNNNNENAARYKVESVLQDTMVDLDELKEEAKECVKRFDKIKSYENWKEEMRRISRKIENFDEESTAIEDLESLQYEIEHIAEELIDLKSLMGNYSFFYETLQRRNAVETLKERGIAITNTSVEEELKRRGN
ncbi:hypothetical protein ACFLXJ_04425 [Chloroflexota bacterium]